MEGGFVMNNGLTAPKERFIYRVKFTKGEKVKFIGHLDVLRVFQRAIRRAGLPVAYSNGFNPHQLLSFASPLTLGMKSVGEYAEVEMKQAVDPKEIVEKLNKTMPEDMEILKAVLLPQQTKNAMASVEGALYEVTFFDEVKKEELKKILFDYEKQTSIVILKKTKRGLKETDIHPDIWKIELDETKEKAVLRLFLAAGSKQNLKPDLVAQSICRFMNIEYKPFSMQYKRLELYKMENETLIPLMEEK